MHYISTFQSADPQRGIGMMPKRGCDVNTCEIAKFYRLNNNGLCQVVSMTVPRRSELFQEDLYPDTLSDEAAVTAEEWIGGTDTEPVMVSLKVRAFVRDPMCILSVGRIRSKFRLGLSLSTDLRCHAKRIFTIRMNACT